MNCRCGGEGCGLDVFMSTEDIVSWQADPPDEPNIQRGND
jgi:hypothetical protein